MGHDERYICIHGHFYQPPRENPWLEAIEVQDSARPFHDWNERITHECYGANASSRILDEAGRILEIVNNYEKISFNFGPTLLSWMEVHHPHVHAAIVEADVRGRERFSGHGPALAQVYNHLIMPLANRRDQRTQIIWGLRDFAHRFGRPAEGMWLAETAVDTQTLELLAEEGVRFTILAPHQAARVRPLAAHGDEHEPDWQEVNQDSVDTKRPYVQRLPSGREIALFFYDGPISRGVAFEKLLDRGEKFAGRLTGALSKRREGPQLVHIATDGETYGHHHKYGEMALSYALKQIEEGEEAQLTLYGEFLDRHPPTWEAQIVEQSSWSCAHGVERWRSNCGCHTGGAPGWDQRWRAPLRRALDQLRDAITLAFEARGEELFHDVWSARDRYIEVVLRREEDAVVDAFLERELRAGGRRTRAQEVSALELMELQRQAMLMYTSCGWFFNDLAGIETIQIMQYAARVIQLARRALGMELEASFLSALREARSNVVEEGSGAQLYERYVVPARVDLKQVCAHYAIDVLFEPLGQSSRCYCYQIDALHRELHDAGSARMVLGVAQVSSRLTRRAERFEYSALHLGDHNVDAGVREVSPEAQWDVPQTQEFAELGDEPSLAGADYRQAKEVFARGEFPTLIRMLDRSFGDETYTLRSLFKDEQRKVIEQITARARQDALAVYRQIYERRAPLLSFLSDLEAPVPREFAASADVALSAELEKLVLSEELPRAEITSLLSEVRNMGAQLDWQALSMTVNRRLTELVRAWRDDFGDVWRLRRMARLLDLCSMGKVEVAVSFWEMQNAYMEAVASGVAPAARERAEAGDEQARKYLNRFVKLGEMLHISPLVVSRAVRG